MCQETDKPIAGKENVLSLVETEMESQVCIHSQVGERASVQRIGQRECKAIRMILIQ